MRFTRPRVRLTAAERQALAMAVEVFEDFARDDESKREDADALRRLCDRTKLRVVRGAAEEVQS